MQENEVKNSQAAEQALLDGEKLTAFLNSVAQGEYRAVVNKILERCMISYATFGNWRSGKCRIPELHKSAISEIAGYSVF